MRISNDLFAHLHSDWVIYFRSGGGTRNAPRALASFAATLSRGGSELNEESFDVEVAEISVSGAGLIHNQTIAAGEQVVLHLRKDDGAQVAILCVARRSKPVGDSRCFVGMEFLQV